MPTPTPTPTPENTNTDNRNETFGNIQNFPSLGNGDQINQDQSNFIPSNDPTSIHLLDMKEHPELLCLIPLHVD